VRFAARKNAIVLRYDRVGPVSCRPPDDEGHHGLNVSPSQLVAADEARMRRLEMERQCPFFDQLHSKRPHQDLGKVWVRVPDASQLAFVPLSPCTKKMLWTCVLDHTTVVAAVRP
jgi:hypothetical protein